MMQAERGRRNSFPFSDNGSDANGFGTIPATSSSSSSPTAGGNSIEHRVSRRDTLAGVAIKYGVEVADIKRMNGLVTDLQMFAHKSLHIPLPGRHPPSPDISDGSDINGEHTSPQHPLDDVLDSFQSLKLKPPQCRASLAMTSLQGDYGLKHKKGLLAESPEMAVYQSVRGYYLDDQPIDRKPMVSDPVRGRHRKCRSLVNIVSVDSSEAERSIRRRQKADVDPFTHTPEFLLKDDTFGEFSRSRGKNLAQRPKMGTRMDADMAYPNAVPTGDSFKEDSLVSVRKSSSTSNFQELDNGSFMWPSSKWSLKPDAFARPNFDGLSKPMIIKKNKAALD